MVTLTFTLSALLLGTAYGLVVTAPTISSSADAKLLSKRFSKTDLAYGPAHGVDHAHPVEKDFDDTNLILTPGSKDHREMWKIACFHENPGNHFNGLTEYYKIPGNEGTGSYTFTNFRGYTPVVGWRNKENSYALKAGESWAFITYRYCGRKLTGIHFGTDKVGGGIGCGDYDFNKVEADCGGEVLRPPAGRRMIGIYGNENGQYWTKGQGIRGIGMITVAI